MDIQLRSLIDAARKTSTKNIQPTYSSFAELITERKVHSSEQDIYLVYYDMDGIRTEYSYPHFIELVSKTAQFYLNSGIHGGDRIAIAAHNHPDTIIQYFAAWMIGACIVPLNMTEDDKRIQYILENSSARLLLCRSEYMARISSIYDDKNIVVQEVDTESHQHKMYDELIASQEEYTCETYADNLSTEALIVYTSGTTGNPKAVVLDQRNLMIDAHCISEWHRITKDSRMMCVLPVHHVNGCVVTHVTPMYAHASVVLNRKFSTEAFFTRIDEEKVTVVSVVPTLLAYLLEGNIPLDAYSNTTLQHIICGAGPLTCDLASNFENTFNIPIIHGYGLSETTCYSSFLPIDQSKELHKEYMFNYGFPSIGIPIPCNEMQIHDIDGNPLPENTRGEIVIRGTNVMKEYYNNDSANQETFAHKWFRSGDEGFWITGKDNNPYFFITGRIKELIIRGGVNLAPLEIDEVLSRAPGVKAGICVGFENDFYGEEVGALIIPDNDAVYQNEIIEYCKQHLPFSKQPKCVIFTDQLPVTSTGKYQRNTVKHLFSEYKNIQFKK